MRSDRKNFKNDKFVNSASEGDEIEIIYESNTILRGVEGTASDQKKEVLTDCKIKVKDTQKKMGDLFVHFGKIEKGSISNG